MPRNVDRENKKSPKIGVKYVLIKNILVFAVVLLVVIAALLITLLCVKLLKKENSVTTNEPASTSTIPEITTTPLFTTSTITTEDTTTTEIISTTTLDDSTSTSTTDAGTTFSTIESSSLSSSVVITSPSTTETSTTESTTSLSESSSTTTSIDTSTNPTTTSTSEVTTISTTSPSTTETSTTEITTTSTTVDSTTTSTIESSSTTSTVTTTSTTDTTTSTTSPSTTEDTTTESTSTLMTTSDTTISTTESSSTTSSVETTTYIPENYTFYSRDVWTDSPLNNAINLLNLPLKRVIVAHTADSLSTCTSKVECIARIQSINSTNLNLLDVPYNYFIGGDGNVYEGRGYRHEGEHTNNLYGSNYNDIGIGIAFIGTYENEAPPQRQTDALDDFLYDLVENRTLSSDYKVFYQDQLKFNSVRSTAINDQIKNMSNFYDLQRIYTRTDWGAQDPCGSIDVLLNPQNRSIIYQTATEWACGDPTNCTDTLLDLQANILISCSDTLKDVHYAFVIGGTDDFAMVMEGRGFSNVGAHYARYNELSISIALIGKFESMIPGVAMLNALEQFLKDAAALGKLTEVYILNGRFLGTGVGANLENIIKNWPNYELL